jgi:hypothetical protein
MKILRTYCLGIYTSMFQTSVYVCCWYLDILMTAEQLLIPEERNLISLPDFRCQQRSCWRIKALWCLRCIIGWVVSTSMGSDSARTEVFCRNAWPGIWRHYHPLIYPACKAHAPYFIVIMACPGCTIFLRICLLTEHKICVLNISAALLKHLSFQKEFSDIYHLALYGAET